MSAWGWIGVALAGWALLSGVISLAVGRILRHCSSTDFPDSALVDGHQRADQRTAASPSTPQARPSAHLHHHRGDHAA
jgi:hypothetical protein